MCASIEFDRVRAVVGKEDRGQRSTLVSDAGRKDTVEAGGKGNDVSMLSTAHLVVNFGVIVTVRRCRHLDADLILVPLSWLR